MYRKDRNGRGGGIIVYVNDTLKAVRRLELEKCDIETLWLEICFPKARSLLTCYVYIPPSSPMTWFAQFEAQLEVASSLNCDITLLGDFNIG